MIVSLYKPFQYWSDGGSIWILSDTHFDDADCKLMDENWITPQEQIDIINLKVMKSDTFVLLGDVGNPKYISEIKARKKMLLLGNHDKRKDYDELFTEIYTGPLMISDKILLSHEPIPNLKWCVNIHGHDHSGCTIFTEECKHINVAANMCNYTPVNLGALIKQGLLSDVVSIHRLAIEEQKRHIV